MTIALALHELQTNASKHGSLSSDEGRVALYWKIVEMNGSGHLWMQWSESGGPAVAPLKRFGFGPRQVSTATARALSGEAILDYTPEGLTGLLIAPLDQNRAF